MSELRKTGKSIQSRLERDAHTFQHTKGKIYGGAIKQAAAASEVPPWLAIEYGSWHWENPLIRTNSDKIFADALTDSVQNFLEKKKFPQLR